MQYLHTQCTTGTQLYIDPNGPLATTDPSSEEFLKDVESGMYFLHYITKCSWWEWNNGSQILLWQWTPEFKTFAQDGIPVCFINQD